MASSYDRVFGLLNETDGAQAIRERVRKALENARITEWRFRLTDEGGKPFVQTTFTTSFGPHFDYFYHGAPVNAVYLDPLAHVEASELKEIVHRHFGHGVPTFFCRKEVVLKGCSKERGRKSTESYVGWTFDKIREETADAKAEAEKRVLAQAAAIVESAEFKAERQQSLLLEAKADLVRLMRMYAPLGESFMREAVSEFVVADVLEG